MMAKDMVPGGTYMGTKDGPTELEGVHFTVFSTVSFNPHATFTFMAITPDERELDVLVQVQYDAWGYPFPEVSTFAPGDWVLDMDTTCQGSLQPLGIAARSQHCNVSFGFPHPANKVVGSLAPEHAKEPVNSDAVRVEGSSLSDCPFYGAPYSDTPEWAKKDCWGPIISTSGLCEGHHNAQPAKEA